MSTPSVACATAPVVPPPSLSVSAPAATDARPVGGWDDAPKPRCLAPRPCPGVVGLGAEPRKPLIVVTRKPDPSGPIHLHGALEHATDLRVSSGLVAVSPVTRRGACCTCATALSPPCSHPQPLRRKVLTAHPRNCVPLRAPSTRRWDSWVPSQRRNVFCAGHRSVRP